MCSLKQNDVFLEAAQESFEENLEAKNYQLVEDIMADVKQAGFFNEYADMHSRYTLKRFSNL